MYGPNNSNIRKDLWVEMKDLFGLTFPKNDVCVWVGDDFNIIKRISEEFGKRYFYAYVIYSLVRKKVETIAHHSLCITVPYSSYCQFCLKIWV